jgi:hypothetical protein
MEFIPHGSFRLLLGKHVILCSLHASFNYEAALELSRRVKEILSASPRKANLIDNRPWGLATPEASEVLAELNRWSIGMGLCRSAHVTEDPLTKAVIDHNLSPDSERYIRRHFADMEGARQWLADEGYPISDEELRELEELADRGDQAAK